MVTSRYDNWFITYLL